MPGHTPKEKAKKKPVKKKVCQNCHPSTWVVGKTIKVDGSPSLGESKCAECGKPVCTLKKKK